MARMRTAVVVVGLVVAFAAGVAHAQEAALKDYMPMTVGSKWMMKTSSQRGEGTATIEVLAAQDVNGQQGMPIVTKSAEGQVRRGSIEAVTEESYILYGSIFGNRQGGGEPTTTIYDPPATFPGKMSVGQSAEAQIKVSFGGQETTATTKLELAAIESVTVPKGTFADCLKLVATTSFGQGTMTRTTWYAKGVGVVKSENKFGDRPPSTNELTDYTLAP